jgi:hypothetical protein
VRPVADLYAHGCLFAFAGLRRTGAGRPHLETDNEPDIIG